MYKTILLGYYSESMNTAVFITRTKLRLQLYPLPQLIGIIAMIFVALNNSPDPAVTKQVYTISGGILAGVSVIAWGWVKFAMKKKLFEPDLT